MKGLKAGQVPLERAFSKLGIASRAIAREWILAGKVRVNGIVRKDPEFGVVPERAILELNGKRLDAARPRCFILHKPRGVVTTRSDEKGRPTVFSLMSGLDVHLIAVGRLDWATSGLLILTNDTRLSDWLTDPSNQVPRTYLVSVRGEVTDEKIERLREGIRDGTDVLQADQVILRKASGRESHLTVQLTEGKNREVRRMFASIGHEVTRLKRVAFGGLDLGELPVGKHREVMPEELARAFPGLPSAPVRPR